MRGAAMSLTAAVNGFVVSLLSVSVIHGQDGWGVNYTSTDICAINGSTVDINCTYKYPPDKYIRVLKRIWFTKGPDNNPENLTTDSHYTGRVKFLCDDKVCTLRIADLRQNDSAVYKFRFETNQSDGKFTGQPGVKLSVTALSVQVIKAASYPGSNMVEMQCNSSCDLPTYIWYNKGQKIEGQTSSNISVSVHVTDSFSCAVKGQETFPSPSVYPPKLPSVSVSPSAEIVEGSSVNLTCSSDANPAANYTWYKENEDSPKASGQIFTITDFRPEHSGNYYCEAQNTLGRQTSDLHFIGQPGISTAGVTAAVLLPLLILLCVYVWIRKRRVSKESSEPEERTDKGEQCLPDQGQTEEQDNLQYASVHFSEKQADAVYSNIRAAQPSRQEQEVTEYSPLRFIRDSTAPRFQSQDTEENPAALYSTINKT
ncbi:carcinoembryonic antigen-related cell adhesion molecule 6-like [Channa argus]|uniref:carcinoembryonic antigen-related cell adhesion molecule 6-like n=1 Tax=Channa argus TaxID=215402 RepID=UPI002948A39D|nr:hypothetical protein Q8A73_002945 [Channa argus]